jgi:heat shock protein HslJ
MLCHVLSKTISITLQKMKRIFLVAVVFIGLIQAGWAKRINPNLMVNGKYSIVGIGAKNTTPKYAHNLIIDKGTGEMSIDGAKTKMVIAAAFNPNQKIVIGKSKKISTAVAAKKAQDAETVKIATALKKANRFEKKGGALRLYKDTTLLCTLNEIVEIRQAKTTGENGRVVISETGDMTVLPLLNGKYRILQQLQDGEMKDYTSTTTLVEFGDDNVTAYCGCNRMNAHFVGTNNRIKVDAIMMTRMSCEDEKNKMDAATSKNLTAATAYRIEGNKAFLLDAEDKMIMMLESKR